MHALCLYICLRKGLVAYCLLDGNFLICIYGGLNVYMLPCEDTRMLRLSGVEMKEFGVEFCKIVAKLAISTLVVDL